MSIEHAETKLEQEWRAEVRDLANFLAAKLDALDLGFAKSKIRRVMHAAYNAGIIAGQCEERTNG